MDDVKQFMKVLKYFRSEKMLTLSQYSTLKGQVYSGDVDAARKGMIKLLAKYVKEND